MLQQLFVSISAPSILHLLGSVFPLLPPTPSLHSLKVLYCPSQLTPIQASSRLRKDQSLRATNHDRNRRPLWRSGCRILPDGRFYHGIGAGVCRRYQGDDVFPDEVGGIIQRKPSTENLSIGDVNFTYPRRNSKRIVGCRWIFVLNIPGSHHAHALFCHVSEIHREQAPDTAR